MASAPYQREGNVIYSQTREVEAKAYEFMGREAATRIPMKSQNLLQGLSWTESSHLVAGVPTVENPLVYVEITF
jgi:hypothetical protein